MAGPPFLFGSFLRSALSFKCLFAKESGVWKVHRLAVDLWTLQNTQICHVDLFLQSHPVHNFIMLEIESADVHLLKSEPCQPAKKIVSVTLLRRGFPVFETTWVDPLPSQHVTAQYLEWHYRPQHVGVKGFFTLIIAVEDPSRLSRWWSLPP